MFSVIDIETTGGHAQYHGITEVAIINFDGERITDQFSTLIRADEEIPRFITHLTGITNEMIADAPEWEEVMDRIEEMTRDRILIAHNAHFDYSFLKNAFLQSGKSFQRKTLCTVRLSREIFPGLSSYSLKKLCEHLKVSAKPTHRAFADAMAALEVFKMLKENDSEKKIETAIRKRTGEFRLPPHLERETIPSLPPTAGVYYFLDERQQVLYVGKAKNIKSRILQHFTSNSTTRSRTRLMNTIHDIRFELCGSELVALLKESSEIKKHFPPYNSTQKISDNNFGLYCYEDGKGYLRLALKQLKKFDQPIIAFSSLQESRSFISEKVKEFKLCAKLSGLQQSPTACFDHQAGICDGACIGAIDVVEYNERMKNAIRAMKEDSISCAIIMQGRTHEERSLVVMENGKYIGFGFAPEQETAKPFQELRDLVSPQRDNRETQLIIRAYLQNHNDYQLVFAS